MTRKELFETIDYHCFNTPDFDRELFDNWYDVCVHIVKKTTDNISDETIKELSQWVMDFINEVC